MNNPNAKYFDQYSLAFLSPKEQFELWLLTTLETQTLSIRHVKTERNSHAHLKLQTLPISANDHCYSTLTPLKNQNRWKKNESILSFVT